MIEIFMKFCVQLYKKVFSFSKSLIKEKKKAHNCTQICYTTEEQKYAIVPMDLVIATRDLQSPCPRCREFLSVKERIRGPFRHTRIFCKFCEYEGEGKYSEI